MYNVDADFAPRAQFAKHNAYMTHFDFSADSRYIQSNCGAYELLFSDAATGAHITAAATMKNVDWATQTCVLGWPVQGIWPPASDGTDINALDRSHNRRVLATADDFGKVGLVHCRLLWAFTHMRMCRSSCIVTHACPKAAHTKNTAATLHTSQTFGTLRYCP